MTFSFGSAFAGPSAKATSNAGDLAEVAFASAAPIFTQIIHTAQQKDLLIDVSLECGLTTNTKVMSKNLKRAISEAEAIVEVWVEVDPVFVDGEPIERSGNLAEPGVVTFARRYQALIAEFAGSFSTTKDEWQDCFVKNNGITTIDPDCLDPEMVALILDTMTANTFNFVQADLDAGDHTIVVWANLDYRKTGEEFVDSENELADWAPENISTRAYLGKGSVTVESVRFVKGDGPVEIE
jgi:hypothetical protein